MRFYQYMMSFCMVCMSLLCFFLLYKLSVRPNFHETKNAEFKQEVKSVVMADILVSNRQLYAGEILKSSDIAAIKIPQAFVSPGTLVDSKVERQNVVGTLLRVSIPKNSPIRGNDLVRPGDGGFLAALLTPGKRAAAVAVDAASAVGGLIAPGDFVDVLFVSMNQAEEDEPYAAMLFPAIHVVAVDQRLIRGKGNEGNNQNIRTVILELTPDEVQKLTLAEKSGKIILSLRSLKSGSNDNEVSDKIADISFLDKKDKKTIQKQPDSIEIRVFNGDKEFLDNEHS